MAATITSITHYSGDFDTHFHPYANLSGLTPKVGSPYAAYRILIDGGDTYAFTVLGVTASIPMLYYEFEKDIVYSITLWECPDFDPTGPPENNEYDLVDTEALQILQPGAPILSAPADGAILSTWDDTFTWASGGNTDEYFVYVDGESITGGSPSGSPSYPSDPLPLEAATYTLSEENIWYTGYSDYETWFDPYNNTTFTWKILATNEWCDSHSDGTSSAERTFMITPGYVPPTDPFPEPRPDPPDDDPYPGMSITGGGRFGTTLLAISDNDDVGVIYYRTV